MSSSYSERQDAFNVALRIVKTAGEKIEIDVDGEDCTVMVYEDPWDAGLMIRYGGVNGGVQHLTVHNDYGNGLLLLSAVCIDDEWFLREFDETTAWTLFLSACDADVRDKY